MKHTITLSELEVIEAVKYYLVNHYPNKSINKVELLTGVKWVGYGMNETSIPSCNGATAELSE